jgi:hypothetical protein
MVAPFAVGVLVVLRSRDIEPLMRRRPLCIGHDL